MRKKFFLWGLLCAGIAVFSACSGDDTLNDLPIISAGKPIFGDEQNPSVQWTSSKVAQDGQKHRSSDNQSLKLIGDAYKYIVWNAPDGVTFKVMQDKTGTDPTLVELCYKGCITENFYVDGVYIADPNGASSSFTVTATGYDVPEGATMVSVNNGPLPGQSNRCSENFTLIRDNARYEVVCSDNVTFDIWNDVTAATDDILYTNVKNGDIIYAPEETKLYAVNPRTTDKSTLAHPFYVLFQKHDPAWMSKIPDSTPLTALSIPGSHDACTYTCGSGMSKCQNFNITYQLNAGIRYFDVRPDDEGKIFHGIIPTDCTMEMVMDACTGFLKSNPSEMIILQISAGRDKYIYDYIKNLFSSDKYKDYIDCSSTLKKLSDYRGKIVVFRRFSINDDTKYGIDLTKWPDDGVDEFENSDGCTIYVQDRFYDTDETTHDTKEKSRLVRDAILHADSNTDILHINFNSVAGRVSSWPWNYAWGSADPRMSESLAYTLNYYKQGDTIVNHTGIILLDFFNANGYDDEYHLVESIINVNLTEEQYPKSKLNPRVDVDKLLSTKPDWWQ